MGNGSDTNSSLFWGNNTGILSNTEGDVTLLSKFRVEADTYAWPNTDATLHAIVVDDVQYNAPGDDGSNPNGEWIVIRNAGAETADLTGWRVNNGSVDYEFDAVNSTKKR